MCFERTVQIGLRFGRILLTIVLCVNWQAAHAANGPLEGVTFPVSPEALAGLIQQADNGSLPPETLDPLIDGAKHSALDQLRFLKAIGVEKSRGASAAIDAFGRIAGAGRSPFVPDLAAAASFRKAELLVQQGSLHRATAAPGRARRWYPDGEMWVKQNGRWTRDSSRAVTEKLFLEINGTSLSYRFLRRLSGWLPFAGWFHVFLGMLALAMLLRGAQCPAIVRLARQEMVSASWRGALVGGCVVMEIATIGWFVYTDAIWDFAFGASYHAPLGTDPGIVDFPYIMFLVLSPMYSGMFYMFCLQRLCMRGTAKSEWLFFVGGWGGFLVEAACVFSDLNTLTSILALDVMLLSALPLLLVYRACRLRIQHP